MKTLTYSQQDVQEHKRGASSDVAFANRFVARNLRAIDTALKVARTSIRRGKNTMIRTHAEFRRAIAVKQ